MEPIKIGWLGSALDGPDGGYDRIHRLAFDEAAEQGLLDRPVEFVLHPENGLPQGSAKNATDGFRYLVDEGCIGVAGAYSSDNAITVGPLANELEVPLISWCGTERLHGDYCFRLGNGDCGGDAALVVAWLKQNGHERVRLHLPKVVEVRRELLGRLAHRLDRGNRDSVTTALLTEVTEVLLAVR